MYFIYVVMTLICTQFPQLAYPRATALIIICSTALTAYASTAELYWSTLKTLGYD